MDASKITNNLLAVTASQNSPFYDAMELTPELCTNQTWNSLSLLTLTAGFLKDHYIEIAARTAGLIAGNRAVMRSVQPGTFPMPMIAAAGLRHFTMAFVPTTAILVFGEALQAAASGHKSNYVHKTELLVKEHPYTTTAAAISGLIGAILSAKAFDQWNLPQRSVTQAAVGAGIITYLTTSVTLRLIHTAISILDPFKNYG